MAVLVFPTFLCQKSTFLSKTHLAFLLLLLIKAGLVVVTAYVGSYGSALGANTNYCVWSRLSDQGRRRHHRVLFLFLAKESRKKGGFLMSTLVLTCPHEAILRIFRFGCRCPVPSSHCPCFLAALPTTPHCTARHVVLLQDGRPAGHTSTIGTAIGIGIAAAAGTKEEGSVLQPHKSVAPQGDAPRSEVWHK